jgi:3-hydroxyacyl-[acyl-carrier-protein] dehydratase
MKAGKPCVMDIAEIMRYLPHRYPFLLVDRIIELDQNKSIRGIKNVTMNEPFFEGHFPGYPVMPGVLVIEALAQLASILAWKISGRSPGDGTIIFFATIDNARFRQQVRPGDQLLLESEVQRMVRGVGKVRSPREGRRRDRRRSRPDGGDAHTAEGHERCVTGLRGSIRPRSSSLPPSSRPTWRSAPIRSSARTVSIGPGSVIGPHAVITGRTRLGARNRVFQFASIGEIRRTASTPASRRRRRSATTTSFASS